MIDAACRQIAEWRDSAVGPVHVAVNVSSRQFAEGDLEARVALARVPVAPELLELELTETALMSNAERTITVLGKLKRSASRWPSTISAPAIPRWPTCSASPSTS
jgi:EAL domain-containing protein (putative c-di-GMP-specific phosphodiesterase class I)